MTTLIGQRLREFREGLIVMTCLCGVVVLIELGCWSGYLASSKATRVRAANLDRINKAYEKGTARYDEVLAIYEE